MVSSRSEPKQKTSRRGELSTAVAACTGCVRNCGWIQQLKLHRFTPGDGHDP